MVLLKDLYKDRPDKITRSLLGVVEDVRVNRFLFNYIIIEYLERVQIWGEPRELLDECATSFLYHYGNSIEMWTDLIDRGLDVDAENYFWNCVRTSHEIRRMVWGDWMKVLTADWPDMDNWGCADTTQDRY